MFLFSKFVRELFNKFQINILFSMKNARLLQSKKNSLECTRLHHFTHVLLKKSWGRPPIPPWQEGIPLPHLPHSPLRGSCTRHAACLVTGYFKNISGYFRFYGEHWSSWNGVSPVSCTIPRNQLTHLSGGDGHMGDNPGALDNKQKQHKTCLYGSQILLEAWGWMVEWFSTPVL